MTLDLKLKVGENCIFGINCASKFCSPSLKVCTKDAITPPKLTEIKDSTARKYSTMGGMCKTPFDAPYSCITADNGEPLEEWDATKCGCEEQYLAKAASGAWVCGMPQMAAMKAKEKEEGKVTVAQAEANGKVKAKEGEEGNVAMDIKAKMKMEEDLADALAAANADKLVNKITSGKAMVLEALVDKIKKINEILVKGVNKRAHKTYAFAKLNQVARDILNIHSKKTNADATTTAPDSAATTAADGAATPAAAAKTEEEKAKEKAEKEALDKEKAIAEEEKKKKEAEEKAIAEEKKKREEEEKKRLEEEKKLVDEYKKQVDDIVLSVGTELDDAIGK